MGDGPRRSGVRWLALGAISSLGCLGGDAPEGIGRSAEAIHMSCATRTEVRGIDVSQWQGAIQWSRLPGAGVRFAIIRLSNGMSLDTRFAENWSGAAAAGVLRGAYHYFNATLSGTAQANYFIDQLTARGFGPGDLPPMLDVEYTNVDSNGDGTNDRPSVTPAVYQARLREWIDTVRARLGRDPIVYTGGYYWDAWVQSSEWASLPLFHAEYPNYSTRRSWSDPVPNGGCARYVSNHWPRYTFWQYAGDNTVASSLGGAGTFGSSAVDMDVFDGTLDELRALARVTPSLDARYVTEGSDAAAETDGSGAQFHVCAGQPVRFFFELENVGGAAWTDAAAPGATAGGAVRLGTVPHDTPDPLTGETRVSLNRATSHVVRAAAATPAGADCNDRDGCRRTVFRLEGRAPMTPGVVRSRWQLLDELRQWFGPEVWLSFHVVACPVDAGAPPADAGTMVRDAGSTTPTDTGGMTPGDAGSATRDAGTTTRDASGMATEDLGLDAGAAEDVGVADDVAAAEDAGALDDGASDAGAGADPALSDGALEGSCRAVPTRARGSAGLTLLALAALGMRRRRVNARG